MFIDSGFSFFFSIFGIMFLLVFVLVIIQLVRGIKEWHQNNESPRLNVQARIVDKHTQTDIHHHHSGNHEAMHTSSSTTYYVTFEVASGDRMVFRVSHTEYGMLVKGDQGVLNFQGTRYLGFERAL